MSLLKSDSLILAVPNRDMLIDLVQQLRTSISESYVLIPGGTEVLDYYRIHEYGESRRTLTYTHTHTQKRGFLPY